MRINFSRAICFEQFTINAAREDKAILDDIFLGKISTEAQRQERHDELANRSFDVLPDSWRALASKQGKTKEEFTQTAQEYEQGFTNFGNEYVNYIDKRVGNNDGKLTKDEYVKFESESNPEGAEYAKNIFAHIDIDKSGDIDKKEMAAMMSMCDMSVGLQGDKAGDINGKIKVCDMRANMMNLINPSGTEDGNAMDAKLKGMYQFLYPNN